MHKLCIITPIALTRQNIKNILPKDKFTHAFLNTFLEYYEYEKADGRPFDLFIIEHSMSETELLEFMGHINNKPSGVKIPIMVLSSASDRATILNLLHQGADDYVLKPFEPTNLLERIDRLINLYLPDMAKLFPQTLTLDLGTILELEVAKAQRHNYSFSFVRLFFTIIESSTQGHPQKGRELVEVMRICYTMLQSQYRKTDMVIAFGEDSFVICLPYTDKEGTLIVIRRMSHELEKLKVNFPPNYFVEIGNATFPADGNDPTHLLNRVARGKKPIKHFLN